MVFRWFRECCLCFLFVFFVVGEFELVRDVYDDWGLGGGGVVGVVGVLSSFLEEFSFCLSFEDVLLYFCFVFFEKIAIC